MHRLRLLGLGLVLALLPLASPDSATALLPSKGSVVAYGMLAVPGLTTSPSGVVQDPAQWATWPSRAWELTSTPTPLAPQGGPCVTYRAPTNTDIGHVPLTCNLRVTGTVFGWCDLSRGAGAGNYTVNSVPNSSATLDAWRWSGAGPTLAVTAYLGTSGTSGRLEGSVVGTVTMLQSGATTLHEQCSAPGGVQSPIPVLIELEYVLQ